MSKVVEVEGREIEVPDDATPEEIDEIFRSQGGAVAQTGAEEPISVPVDRGAEPQHPLARLGKAVTEVGGAAARTIGDTVGSAVKGAVGYVTEHPIEATLGNSLTFGAPAQARLIKNMLEGASNQSEEQFTKMYEASDEGRTSEAIGHGAAGALPVAGPIGARIGERAGSGDITGAVGEGLAEAGMAYAGGRLLPKGLAKADDVLTKSRVASRAAKEAERVLARKQAVNEAVGLKPKHIKGGQRTPEDLASRTDFDPKKPPQELYDQLQDETTNLRTVKGARLRLPRTAATADDVRNIAKGRLDDFVQAARDTADKAAVKKALGVQKTFEEILQGKTDLSPKEVNDLLVKRVDGIINHTPKKDPFYKVLTGLRRDLAKKITEGDPYLGEVNEGIRSRTPALRALEEKMLRERVQGSPEVAKSDAVDKALRYATNPFVPAYLRGPAWLARFMRGR